jgi:hypothetical protein
VAAVEIDLDRQIAHDRRQPLAASGLVDPGGQGISGSRRSNLVEVGDDRLDVAVLRNQRFGRLLANTGDAGDVVRGVANQRLVVGDVLGTKAVTSPDRVRVEVAQVSEALGSRQNDRRVLVDELQQVAIARNDDHFYVTLVTADAGEAADDIVSLVARTLFDRDVQSVDQLPHALDLRPQIVGHGPAVRLVLGELFIPKRRPPFQGDDRVFRLLPSQHVQ